MPSCPPSPLLSPVLAMVDLIAPPRCATCHGRLAPGRSLPWCAACGVDVQALSDGCRRCGAPGTGFDTTCPLGDSAVAATVAAHPWTGTVAATVRAGKLDGCHAVFGPLGRVVGRVLSHRMPDWPPVDLVCPVPSHPRRRRRRGHDHAEVMARSAAAEAGLDCASLLTMASTAPDRGASRDRDRADRTTWAASAAMAVQGSVSGHVVVVDDVVTSGTTVATAAVALRRAGANRVSVAALARAGGH